MGIVTRPCFGIHSTAATGDVEDHEEYYDEEEEDYENEVAAEHEQHFDGVSLTPGCRLAFCGWPQAALIACRLSFECLTL
jgi:hypothetical protein